ncbi:hypothetical protein [Kutzneria sp. NPDC052558]|uniref:hypothetical protein n=1 Tax=Kutzneria sp. NPDC052558 TaxID=3364121 RepID=UPI0037C532D2
MTVFVCQQCRAPLTRAVVLVELPDPGDDREPTMGRGTYAVDPEPFGPPYVPAPPDSPALRRYSTVSVSDGPKGTIVLHPEDFRLWPRRIARRSIGCCGPAGTDGPNLVCWCDTEIATEVNDCYTPHEIRLEPDRVTKD